MFRYFPKHGNIFVALIALVIAIAFFWEPAIELIGDYETWRLNERARREGWVGGYSYNHPPIEVKRIGD